MPRKKARTSLNSFVVQAENTKPQSCADFRRKWTPTEFCRLSLRERRTILLGLLASPDPVFIVQVDGGYNFATAHTPIHEAMPLLYDFSTNKQIAREACEVFYQNNTFVLPSRWLPHILLDQANTWVMGEMFHPRHQFRNLRVLLNHHGPHATPGDAPMELSNLLACNYLERLDIEICIPENLTNDLEAIRQQSINETIALGAVICQLREKFGMALKVLIGGPFAIQKKEYNP